MPSIPGTKLKLFEILAPLGARSTGEVWPARDSKLSREVTIKPLPAGLASDARYTARSESEAQTLRYRLRAYSDTPALVFLRIAHESSDISRFLLHCVAELRRSGRTAQKNRGHTD